MYASETRRESEASIQRLDSTRSSTTCVNAGTFSPTHRFAEVDSVSLNAQTDKQTITSFLLPSSALVLRLEAGILSSKGRGGHEQKATVHRRRKTSANISHRGAALTPLSGGPP
jgi:hypothetical protein